MHVQLSDEQQAVFEAVVGRVRSGERLTTVGGYAGTGKTTMARVLNNRLARFAVCAFTGKACDRLRSIGMEANTIHSTIYRPRDDDQARDGVRYELKSRQELGCDGFLIDEGSMVGKEEFDNLMSFGLPIVVLGDHGQLPPVGEDAGLMIDPMFKLETIHRNAGPIARFAEHLRKKNTAESWRQPNDGDTGVWLLSRRNVTDGQLLAADQIICAYNRTRVGLNRTVRRLLRLPEEPVIGDKIICLRNDKAAGVFNGQQGVIDLIQPEIDHLRFVPRSGPERSLLCGYHPEAWNAEKTPPREKGTEPGRLVPFDFGYALTCHKTQGDEYDKVIVYSERCDKLWEFSRWAYTAASRAKRKLLWVV